MSLSLNIVPLCDWGFEFEHPFVISGPCSAESENQVLQTAQALVSFPVNVLRAGIWKPRTRPGSFEGVGEKGLPWIKNAGKSIGLPVTVEAITPEHVQLCLKHGVDILWVGARTTGNPFAVQALADALQGIDIPVLVKNPLNPDIELWIGALERINRAGITRLGAIHRGFSSFGQTIYRNKPEWSIPIELKARIPDLPLICDPSHLCGRVDLLQPVARKALDLFFDGLMIESHFNPKEALSDAQQQVTPSELGRLLGRLEPEPFQGNDLDYTQDLEHLEEIIFNLDEQIIELLAEHMALSNEIAFIDSHNAISASPEDEKEFIKRRLEKAREKGLDQAFARRLFQFIYEEVSRLKEYPENYP